MCPLADPPLADPEDSFVLVLPAWENIDPPPRAEM